MASKLFLALLAAAYVSGVSALLARRAEVAGRMHANMAPRPNALALAAPARAVTSRNGTALPPYDTTYYFDQLIDHTNPSLGTFKQRYWHTYEFYEEGVCARVALRGARR